MLNMLMITIVLLILSGIFSATETAFTSISVIQETMLKEEKSIFSKKAVTLIKKKSLLITTILIGNNLVNIAASSIITTMTIKYFGDIYIGLSTGLLTLAVLLFGEITPKQMALLYNVSIVRIMSYPMFFLMSAIYPFALLTSSFGKLITMIFKPKKSISMSLDGIRSVVNIASAEGVVEENESNLMKRILHFNDIKVKTIMTHRTKVFSLESQTSINEALTFFLEKRFVRIPIYKDDPENIIGFLLNSELLKAVALQDLQAPIEKYSKKSLYVLENKQIDQLFEQFRLQKRQAAVVLDEYGGFSGVCTLEDIIEELFGDLFENEISLSKNILELRKGTVLVDGSISYYQFADLAHLKTRYENQSTLASYLISMIDRIPTVNETIELEEGSYTINEMIGNRIAKVIFSCN